MKKQKKKPEKNQQSLKQANKQEKVDNQDRKDLLNQKQIPKDSQNSTLQTEIPNSDQNTKTKNNKKQKQLFKNRRKKQSSQKPEQINLQVNTIQIPELNEQIQKSLQQDSKKLKKKITKAPKPPPKIKVKNKFFSDIQIQQKNLPALNHQSSKQSQNNNLIQNQIANRTQSDDIISKSSKNQFQLVFQKQKQKPSSVSESQRLSGMVNKTQFIRTRRDYKKIDQDPMFKNYVKKKLEEVQNVQQIVIESLEVPQIHKNKLISSTLYLNSKQFKHQNVIAQNSRIQKKMTAQQKVKQRKLMKNRDYFYKKLEMTIKEERMTGPKNQSSQDSEQNSLSNNKINKTKNSKNESQNQKSQSNSIAAKNKQKSKVRKQPINGHQMIQKNIEPSQSSKKENNLIKKKP